MQNNMLYIVILFAILMGALLITSCTTNKKVTYSEEFPLLENAKTGKDHEIQKISGYPESTLAYLKPENVYIVSTHLRTFPIYDWTHFWKIDANGAVIDSFATDAISFFSWAGTYFDEEYYIDWPITGDKQSKKYKSVTYLENANEKNTDLFFGSSQVLWRSRSTFINANDVESETKYYYYYKNKELWSLLISKIPLHIDPLPEWPTISHVRFTESDSLHGSEYLNIEEIEKNYPLKTIKWESNTFTWKENEKSNLTLIRFKKYYSVTPSLFSERSWTGRVGEAHLELTFDHTKLSFNTSATAEAGKNGDEISPKLGQAQIPYQDKFTLLKINASYENDHEAGIYIVRRKLPPKEKNKISSIKLHTLQDLKPVIRWAIDSNGVRYDWESRLPVTDLKFPEAIQHQLSYLNLYFQLDEQNKNSRFSIKINRKKWSWDNEQEIYITLYFDSDEIDKAIEKLKGDGVIEIEIDAIVTKEQAKLTPYITSNENRIELTSVEIVSKSSD